MQEKKTGIQVQVVEFEDGNQEVAILILDFNQMLTISAESAQELAFLLMKCSDFIQPPFEAGDTAAAEEDDNEESFFGPYEADENLDDEEDDEEDE